jgi:hypothetical protein
MPGNIIDLHEDLSKAIENAFAVKEAYSACLGHRMLFITYVDY